MSRLPRLWGFTGTVTWNIAIGGYCFVFPVVFILRSTSHLTLTVGKGDTAETGPPDAYCITHDPLLLFCIMSCLL